MIWRVAYTIGVVLLTLAFSNLYERAWPRLFPDPLGPWPDAGVALPGCAPSPWQRVTIVQGGTSQSIFLSCIDKRDEVLVWPTPADGGEP